MRFCAGGAGVSDSAVPATATAAPAAAAGAKQPAVDTIQYPDEEINPDDIPF